MDQQAKDRFSWRDEAVRTGLLAVMFVSLFIVPIRTLLPVFARDLLRVGATGQELLVTAMGIGALCSAVLIASSDEKVPRGILMLGLWRYTALSLWSLRYHPGSSYRW